MDIIVQMTETSRARAVLLTCFLIALGLGAMVGCHATPQEPLASATQVEKPANIICIEVSCCVLFQNCNEFGQSPDGLFQVHCDASNPVRKAVVTCTASNTDASTPTISGWSFVSDSLTNPIVRAGPNITSVQWSGPIVVNGVIAVSGVVAGTAEFASVAIVVTPRDWSLKRAEIPPANDVTQTTMELNGRPLNQEWLGHGWQSAFYKNRGVFTVPADGPNEGLIIFEEIPIRALSDVAYDYRALQAGSYFESLQPTTGHCNKARVVSIIPDVMSHEGFVPTGPDSHVGVFNASIDSIGRRMTEGFLAFGGLSNVQDVALEVHRRAHNVSDAFDNTAANTFSISDDGLRSCDFNYHP
jgi:hypothetical protein